MSPARTLWTLDAVVLVSSAYAITEAARNLDDSDTRARLYRLIQAVEIADEAPPGAALPPHIRLPDKDKPILLAAIHASCTHLLTGDARHFGPWFGQFHERRPHFDRA